METTEVIIKKRMDILEEKQRVLLQEIADIKHFAYFLGEKFDEAKKDYERRLQSLEMVSHKHVNTTYPYVDGPGAVTMPPQSGAAYTFEGGVKAEIDGEEQETSMKDVGLEEQEKQTRASNRVSFLRDLERLINRYSMENDSDT